MTEQYRCDWELLEVLFQRWVGKNKELIRKHSNSNKKLDVDLFDAVMVGNLANIKRLVQAGANVNARKDHFTPLMFAISEGNPEVTGYLIKAGAEVNARNDIGQTPLMLAALGNHKSMVQQLVVAGAAVSAVDDNKRNAITWAASRGDFPEIIGLLAVHGIDYNARDSAGFTPLMSAALLGHVNSVGMLLTLGADETITFRGKTAYDMCLERGHKEVCKTMKAILENRPKGHAL